MLRRRSLAIVAASILLAATACVRRDGRNSDCRWPGENPVREATARHLSADAEFAEDLAIRYADTHDGLRTPNFVSMEAYGAARDRCMQTLFASVAREHGVAVDRVSSSLGGDRGWVDAAEFLPFLVQYLLCAALVTRLMCRRYPPGADGWTPFLTLNLLLSIACAVLAIMFADVWGGLVEGFRVGTGHLSYRMDRVLSVRHHAVLFACFFALFWLSVAEGVWSARRGRRMHSDVTC